MTQRKITFKNGTEIAIDDKSDLKGTNTWFEKHYDEYDFELPDDISNVIEAIMHRLTMSGEKIYLESTPSDKGFFYEMWKKS